MRCQHFDKIPVTGAKIEMRKGRDLWWDELVPQQNPTFAPAQLDSEHPLYTLYTSGTTGKPKGCVLSNDYFLRCGRWYTEIGGLCALRPGEDRLITPLPMTHVNAMAYSTLAMVMTGVRHFKH